MDLKVLLFSVLFLVPGAMAFAHSGGEIPRQRALPPTGDFGIEERGGYVDFSHLNLHERVPERPLKRVLYYYQKNRHLFKNRRSIGVIDFTKSALERRFYLIDLKTGAVESFAVAHGKGSDPLHNHRAGRFSNKPGSSATSIGFYRTAEVYNGKHGRSLRLDGLSTTNSNARHRAIVVHSAWYVSPKMAIGRSNGCFTVDEKVRNRLLERLRGGAMIYAYGGQGMGAIPQDVALR